MRDAVTWYAELRGKCAPLLLVERARREPDAVAYRAKHLGLYRERTWREYAGLVARSARGLAALGLGRGERIAIMGDACEEWILCDLGAQSLGAITYGIYPTASAAEVEYQMRDGGAAIFVAENQEYVDKILAYADALPELRWIVVIDDSAMFAYDHPKLRTFAQLYELGDDAGLDELERLARAVDPASGAFIVYTSGTSGNPKGALVTHGAHLAAAANMVLHYPALAERPHRTVAYLPLCHIFGRDIAVTLPLLSRMVPHFGESLEDLPQTLFEVAPTVLFTVPRYLQKFASHVLVGIAGTSAVKRAAYELAVRIGRRHLRAVWDGHAGLGPVYAAARLAVFRPLLNKLGLDGLELLVAGGAPLPPDTMALWQIWGVNTMELYGQTETAGGIITGQRGRFPRPGSVGDAPPGWEVKLAGGEANRGEILVRSPDLFDGYWGNPEATRETKGEDGWLRTGDVGEWVSPPFQGGVAARRPGWFSRRRHHPGGFAATPPQGEGQHHPDGFAATPPQGGGDMPRRELRLVDRVRDFIVTSGGKTLSPSYIENLLRASPYVAEVMVIGHGRKYLTALVEIDFDTVSDWARARNIAYTGFTSLAQNPEVRRLIEDEIARANGALARVEQVKSFRILPKALDPEEEGEPVTPTRKVKRALMIERFRELVESMYDHREERLLAAGAGDVLRAE
ncbi:MAG: AMP-binding protein [Burkholderiales bacterium]|nr:AMP-binding protein [Burkholderiales bacterium]